MPKITKAERAAVEKIVKATPPRTEATVMRLDENEKPELLYQRRSRKPEYASVTFLGVKETDQQRWLRGEPSRKIKPRKLG